MMKMKMKMKMKERRRKKLNKGDGIKRQTRTINKCQNVYTIYCDMKKKSTHLTKIKKHIIYICPYKENGKTRW